MRNLRIMGLALVAIFAFGAVAASGAMAEGQLTSDGPFYLTGTDKGHNGLRYPGEPELECPESHYVGEEVGGSGPLQSGATSLTVTATYTNCVAGGLPATVTNMGEKGTCDYVFHAGETISENEVEMTADLKCAGGAKVAVDVFLGSSHGTKLCTLEFGETGNQGLGGLVGTDEGGNMLKVEGLTKGITASKKGLCGSGSTTKAEYEVSVTLSGENTKEEPTTVTLD